MPFVSLFNNGTSALITALQSLGLSGEVVTTPYSFIATANSLIWNNLTPVFVDINEHSLNIDPIKIEEAITSRTTAILAVHVYGNPCAVEEIEAIAKRHNLKVIYDAAHAFGVKYKNEGLLKFGDLSILSFHATKVFNTFEGGAVISHSKDMKDKIDQLKNFGIINENELIAVGMNGKMNELQAAMGLLQLKHYDEIISKRKKVGSFYYDKLKDVTGLKTIKISEDVVWNYSYFPILVDESKFGETRDELHLRMQKEGINCRKYFYPLISDFASFEQYVSYSLDNAGIIANSVLCLPIYPELDNESLLKVIKTIIN